MMLEKDFHILQHFTNANKGALVTKEYFQNSSYFNFSQKCGISNSWFFVSLTKSFTLVQSLSLVNLSIKILVKLSVER